MHLAGLGVGVVLVGFLLLDVGPRGSRPHMLCNVYSTHTAQTNHFLILVYTDQVLIMVCLSLLARSFE